MPVKVKKSNMNTMFTPKPKNAYQKMLDKFEKQNAVVGKILTRLPLFTKDGWVKRYGKIQYEILDIQHGTMPWEHKVKIRKLWTKAKGTRVDDYTSLIRLCYDASICNGKHNIQNVSGTDICINCGFTPYQPTQKKYPNIVW